MPVLVSVALQKSQSVGPGMEVSFVVMGSVVQAVFVFAEILEEKFQSTERFGVLAGLMFVVWKECLQQDPEGEM